MQILPIKCYILNGGLALFLFPNVYLFFIDSIQRCYKNMHFVIPKTHDFSCLKQLQVGVQYFKFNRNSHLKFTIP